MNSTPAATKLPHTWCMVPLADLGNWRGGGTPSKQNPAYWTDSGIPWISPKDMKVERIRDTEDHITEVAVASSATVVLAPGSVVVVTRSGILQHSLPVAVTDVPAALNQDLKGLTPAEGIDPTYVAYALRGHEDEILHTCSKDGTTVQSIESGKLLRFELPIAPVSEQRRIVAAIEMHFTRLDAAVAALQRARANLKRYRAAVLKAAVEGLLVPTEDELAQVEGREYETAEALLEQTTIAVGLPAVSEVSKPFVAPRGWSWASVARLSSRTQYGTSAKTTQNAQGVPVIRMGNIVDGRLTFDDLKFLPAAHDEFPALLLEAGDVLFNRTNSAELVGKTAVYHGNPSPCSFASYLIRVQLRDAYLPQLLSYFINSIHGRQWIKTVVNQQVGQANVNGTKLQALVVPVPPVFEQRRIVEEVERRISLIEDLDANIERDLARAERLRQAILRRAFEGKLVPQDPDDEPAAVLLQRIQAERAGAADGRRGPARTGNGRLRGRGAGRQPDGVALRLF